MATPDGRDPHKEGPWPGQVDGRTSVARVIGADETWEGEDVMSVTIPRMKHALQKPPAPLRTWASGSSPTMSMSAYSSVTPAIPQTGLAKRRLNERKSESLSGEVIRWQASHE